MSLASLATTGIWLTFSAFLACCDSNPFGRTERKVAGTYLLEYFDEGGGSYYLIKKGASTQGGVFEAVIEEIGWSQDYIVCKVKKQYGGDVDGIYSVEIATGKVEGPFDGGIFQRDARFKGIKLEHVAKVYRGL